MRKLTAVYAKRALIAALILLALLLVYLTGCALTRIGGSRTPLSELGVDEISPFELSGLQRIVNNTMHIEHSTTDGGCKVCHETADPLPMEEAQRTCPECHNVRTIDDQVWNFHCTVCHHFSQEHEDSGGGYQDIKPLCSQCHNTGSSENPFEDCRTDEKANRSCDLCHRVHLDDDAEAPQQMRPFTRTELAMVVGNAMHESHGTAGAECNDCHRYGPVLTPADAVQVCVECHRDSVVAAEVWSNHCLACHHFTSAAVRAEGNARIASELCKSCHREDEASEKIYAFCEPGASHNITCDRCHQPHKSAIIAGEPRCAECHSDIVGKTHPSRKVHGSCITCHTPHGKREDIAKLCSSCHYPSETVLVHHIPGHPVDCTACHSPHFTEIEIIGEACVSCHQGMFYSGGRNLPSAHRDCENCHYISSFRYKGDRSCASCHSEQGSILDDEQLLSQHRRCTTCHAPHTWRAPFEENCVVCHEIDTVLEHNLDFHNDDCESCHEAHSTSTMAGSGNCEGCHKDRRIPAFGQYLPEEHVTCQNCHSRRSVASLEFSFEGPRGTCLVCHAQADTDPPLSWDQVPAGHHVCNTCHPAHSYDVHPDERSCGTCHRDIFTSPPVAAHGECYNCHQAGHKPDFLGQEVSCGVCHSEAWRRLRGTVKEDCAMCHSSHDFKVDSENCSICHGDVLASAESLGHTDCLWCHSDHQWAPSASACSACHFELSGLHETREHADCTYCHETHSLAAGTNNCTICHAELNEHCSSDNCLECHEFR